LVDEPLDKLSGRVAVKQLPRARGYSVLVITAKAAPSRQVVLVAVEATPSEPNLLGGIQT
jgi:hypothetical protein